MNASTVWVVDDDQVYQQIMLKSIKRSCPQATIHFFDSGGEFLNHLSSIGNDRSQFPKLIFIDNWLPDMFAWDVIKHQQFESFSMKSSATHIHIVSASRQVDKLKEMLRIPGVQGFWLKPIDFRDLRNVLSKARM